MSQFVSKDGIIKAMSADLDNADSKIESLQAEVAELRATNALLTAAMERLDEADHAAILKAIHALEVYAELKGETFYHQGMTEQQQLAYLSKNMGMVARALGGVPAKEALAAIRERFGDLK